MKNVLLGTALLSLITSIGPSPLGAIVKAAPPKCTDIPLRVVLFANTTHPVSAENLPTAMYADAQGEYKNGVSVSAVIKVCSGTYDAVLNLQSSNRTFTYRFPAPIQDSVIDGTWTPGTYSVSGWINVRNILCVGCADPHAEFTTRVGSTFTVPGDRASYRLGFFAESVDAPDLHTDASEIASVNQPFPTSYARVSPQPFDCAQGGTVMPSWLVVGNNVDAGTPAAVEVGTLQKLPSKPHGTAVHLGQYGMPFELRIDALKCFSY